MQENRRSRPLTRATVDWAQDLYAPDDLGDKRIDLAARADFAGLPPTTIILAQIDPLRSGGETLATKLAAAGVPVEARLFSRHHGGLLRAGNPGAGRGGGGGVCGCAASDGVSAAGIACPGGVAGATAPLGRLAIRRIYAYFRSRVGVV